MITPKKMKDESNSSSDKPQPIIDTPKGPAPSALRLILKFEGTDEANDSSSNATANHNSSSQEMKDTSAQHNDDNSFKKSKKKKNKEHKKKHKEKKHPESMYIILDSSESTTTKDSTSGSGSTRKQEISGDRDRQLNVPLRQRHNRSPLQRLLDYAIQQLEDKDEMQVFAWPVTDQIAPGYSKVIKTPMDFSTMRQKINENAYPNYDTFVEDFKTMCNNAMTYNRPDTMYYKSAKRLLHSGLKFLSVEKIRQLANSFTLIKQIPPEQLGFDWETGSPVEMTQVEQVEETNELPALKDSRKRGPGELTAEEALELAKQSACTYDERQFLKRRKTTFSMGFLRQRQDGSTSLAIFVPGEGVDPERPSERVVSLGQLVGKLNQGTGQLQGFREHRRNIAKAVKPLSYGPYGSYAPSYDSTFANLSKDESDLVYGTYGDENPPYIENVLSLAKVCDYTLTMVDNLLDVISGGEHRKSKTVIDDQKKFQEEEERVRNLIEKGSSTNTQNESTNVEIEMEKLKTLSDLGIDTSFLEHFAANGANNNNDPVQSTLNLTSKLIEKLHQVQYDRLSAPPPSHLSQISHPSDVEVQLAEKIIANLTNITKEVAPGAIIPVPSIRKAMGVVPDTADGASTSSGEQPPPLQGPTVFPRDISKTSAVRELDSDLRDILENGSSTCTFQIQDNKSIDEVMSEG